MSEFKLSAAYLAGRDACEKGVKWFLDNVGDGEYTINEMLEMKLSSSPDCADLSWAMREIPELRTEAMFDLYLSLKPDYVDLRWAMRDIPELSEYVKSKEKNHD